MKKIAYIIFLIIVLAGFWAGFYYRGNLLKLYNNVGENLQEFKKTDVATTINQLAQNILLPPPLQIGRSASNVVLTASKVIARTNIQRFDNGSLPPLIENAMLSAAAKAKAEDMFRNQYFEHVSPSGVDPGSLVKKYGYDYILSGENLILGNFKDEAQMVQDWMNSPGHRANILNNRFVDIGVAVVKGKYKGETVWIGVQEFGLPLSACQGPSPAIKAEIDGNIAKLDQLSVQIDAKKQEVDNTNPRSPQYAARVDEYNALVNQYNQLSQTIKNIIGQYNLQVNTFNQCVNGGN